MNRIPRQRKGNHKRNHHEPGKLAADLATISITDSTLDKASFIIPKEAKAGDTIHIILEVSDSGKPMLTRYQRVIVKVTDK